MKLLKVILLLFATNSAFGGECKLINHITKKTGEFDYHRSSKAKIFVTDLSGCLEIAQQNFNKVEHHLRKGYFFAGSAGSYREIDEYGVKSKNSFYLRASNITEPKPNKCEAIYTKEKKLFGGVPVILRIVEMMDEQTSFNPVEECIAKTSAVYLKSIKNGKYERLVVNTILKSKSGAPFEVIIYGHENVPEFSETMQPFIEKLR